MSISRRAFVGGLFTTCVLLPLTPAKACLHAGLSAQIIFDDLPSSIPEGMVSTHIHLINFGPDFEPYEKPMEFNIEGVGRDIALFSLIGVGAVVNPWTHWLVRRLPDWIAGKKTYFPVFAPVGSCTRSFDGKIDFVGLVVGNLMLQENGSPVFIAARKRRTSDHWHTHTGFLDLN